MLLHFISAAKYLRIPYVYQPSVFVSGVIFNKTPRVMRVWERDCVSLCMCVWEYCVFEVRGGVTVCRVAVERFELQQGEGVCEPTASSCSLILSLFLFFLRSPLSSPFPSLFSLFSSCFHSHIHRLAQCASSPSIFSLSSRTGQTGKHTSPPSSSSRLLKRFERGNGANGGKGPQSLSVPLAQEIPLEAPLALFACFMPLLRGEVCTQIHKSRAVVQAFF